MAGLEGRERAAYVRRMFGRIARRYDLLNRLMTFGQDRRWRRIVVRIADLPPGGALLDVATGTGDIALEALHQRPDVRAIGVDFTRAMMHIGQARANGEGVGWVEGDALALPFPDGTFDAAASGYLMRNVVDVPGAFREQMRIVKPGGRVVCLDTTPPRGLLRPLVLLHLKVVIPLLGRVVAGDPAAYTYLPESTQGFKTAEELADIMREAGLVDVRYRRLAMGAMAIHSGMRPEEES
jgi:demethylmenaquinone methyltransferase/2-methoxy-6-polyprenyl-1,4-benzoquinol methylase